MTTEFKGFVLATTNAGKLSEYRELLAGTAISLAPLEAGIDSPEETGPGFVENALIKARHAARHSGCPALADDSGLCVAALGGEPGVHSARYAGPGATDEDNVSRLLDALAAVDDADRAAAFHCVIVAVRYATDPLPVIAVGSWHGRILRERRGKNGFGYDPIFLDPKLGATAAELAPSRKNAVSHRAMACRELRSLAAKLGLA